MRCKTQQNNVLRAKKVAILFSEAQIVSAHFFATQQFSPACFPLPVRGIGRDLCKMVITSPPPTGRATKKGASEKGSFVRIKGLEPPRRKASDPKSDVATNYTISANIRTGTAKAGCKTGFRRCVKRVLSFAKLPENERNRAGLSAKITGSVPVLCKDKESKRQAKQIRACPSRLLSVGKDN